MQIASDTVNSAYIYIDIQIDVQNNDNYKTSIPIMKSSTLKTKQNILMNWLQNLPNLQIQTISQQLYKYLLSATSIDKSQHAQMFDRNKIDGSKEVEIGKQKNKGNHIAVQIYEENARDVGNGIQGLWNKNQYFMAALNDISEDLIWYVYGGHGHRLKLPNCLIGYYQIIKNIVYLRQTKNISSTSKKQHNASTSSAIPIQLAIFLHQKLLSILLIESPLLYIKSSLSKLQQNSQTTLNFYKELSSLIVARLQYFSTLYSLECQVQNNVNDGRMTKEKVFKSSRDATGQKVKKIEDAVVEYFLGFLLGESDVCCDENVAMKTISIDAVMLSIIYGVYRMQRLPILFGQIITIYQTQTSQKINRDKLLQFYNNEFIIKILPIEIMQSLKVSININTNVSNNMMMMKESTYKCSQQKDEKNKNKINMYQMNSSLQSRGRSNKEVMDDQRMDNMKGSGIISICISGFQADIKKEKSIYDMFQ